MTAADLYISIHVCQRESGGGVRARANAARASGAQPSSCSEEAEGSDRFKGDIRAVHKNQILWAGLLRRQLSGG